MIEIRSNGNYTATPAPKEIFGEFIESGFGRQVPGMWAEMIYNRSFRDIPPYKRATWEWLGLDKEHYGPEAPFWHSGYEEYDWEYIGNTKSYLTCGTETHKGTTCRVLISRDADAVAGVKQEGIHLEAGREYIFRIYCRAGHWKVSHGLNGFGKNVEISSERPVKIAIGDNEFIIDASGRTREHRIVFTAKTTGVFPISITYNCEGDLILAYTSLMPSDNIKGWRADVIEKLKESGPTVVRFPGGCFTSFYNWHSSVGPRDRREPQESFYWGGIEENDVGLRELMELAEICGFEGQICFNMMSSTPFDAMCMVEYLNAPADVGYGRLRALDGHPEPFGARLFECDNEPSRKWSAAEYAEQCVLFAREMRKVSPEAKFMLAAYTHSVDSLPLMLEIAGGDMNYVIYRAGHPDFVAKILPVIREYNEKTGRNIKLVNTEWLASCHSPEPFDEPGIGTRYHWDGRIYNDYDKILSRHEISWNYALNGAHRLCDYISYGGEFALANFNNMTNTWGQNIIEASKDKAWLSCMGEIFAFFKRNFSPCLASVAEVGDPDVFAIFTKDDAGKEQLYVINHSGSEKELSIPDGFASVEGMTSERRSAHVTETEKPIIRIAPEVRDGSVAIPKLSVTVFEK